MIPISMIPISMIPISMIPISMISKILDYCLWGSPFEMHYMISAGTYTKSYMLIYDFL